jgi:hypothetical protein
MKRYYALISAFVSLAAMAQPQLSPFWTAQEIPCPFDPTVTIKTYDGWEVYQTVDNTWNGVRDSAYCISLAYTQGNSTFAGIDLDETDRTRPVFIHALLDSATAIQLEQNTQYGVNIGAYLGVGFDVSDTCPDGFCTGISAGVRIPDEWSPGFDMRWYTSGYEQDEWGGMPLSLCVPTEKFEQNDLREVIISLKPSSTATGQIIQLESPTLDDLSWIGQLFPVTETTAPDYYFSQAYHFYDQGWLTNYLVLHPDTTYPSAANIGYVDLAPIPNVDQPTTIPVNLYPFSGFNFQPFTQLRGALVQGSDSVRHSIEVVNQGADICLTYMWLEVFWNEGDRYVHHSGHLDFQGLRSCFMFMPGSVLEVAPNSFFQYGRNGRGMLALRQGSELTLGPNSVMEIHGTLVLLDAPNATERSDYHITLSKGAKLKFATGSRIHNANSIEEDMKLVVTLDGGTIDLAALSAEDQQKVIIVSLPAEELTDILIYCDQAEDILHAGFATREAGSMQFRMIDPLGRLVVDRTLPISPGKNNVELPVHHLRIGAYILEATMNDHRQIIRFVKQ